MTNTPPDAQAEAPPTTKKSSDLLPRVITSVIGVPALIYLAFMAPPLAFGVLIGAAVFIGSWEFITMTMGRGHRPVQLMTCLSAVAVFASMYFTGDKEGPSGLAVVFALVLGMLLQFLTHLFSYKDLSKVSAHIGYGAVALIYCGVMPATIALLHRDGGDLGGVWVMMAFAVVWGSDTGAYFVGRAFGKHKLAPRVSPKKSIEGAVGGLLSSVAAVFIFKYAGWLPDLTIAQVFLIAVPGNILGQVGDLCESLIKRAHDVKDSGVIIYGHGGLLDRIDSVLFAVPWIYFVYRFLI